MVQNMSQLWLKFYFRFVGYGSGFNSGGFEFVVMLDYGGGRNLGLVVADLGLIMVDLDLVVGWIVEEVVIWVWWWWIWKNGDTKLLRLWWQFGMVMVDLDNIWLPRNCKKVKKKKKTMTIEKRKRKYVCYPKMVRKLIQKNKVNDKIGIKNKKIIFKY